MTFPPASKSRALDILLSLALAAAVAGVFWPTTRQGFLDLDDTAYVSGNPVVQKGLTPLGVRWAFLHYRNVYWSPVTYLSHMLDVEWFGLDAGKHHRTNVALHALNAMLLFALLRFSTGSRWCAAMAAAVFAVHPLRVESVAWIAERKDVLCGFFWLATMTAWAHYRRLAAPVWLLFALGLLSKPMFVTLPFVLILFDYWPLGRFGGADFFSRRLWELTKEKLPLLPLCAASSVVTILGQQFVGAVVPLDKLPLSPRLANAALSISLYLRDTFWPQSLGVMYPFFPHFLDVFEVAAGAVILAGITWLAFSKRARAPYFWVGWLWFLGALAPVSGLMQTGSQARADRFTYIPGIGLAVALVWGAAVLAGRWNVRRSIAAALGMLAIAALGAQCRRQTAYWRDSPTLFAHTLAVISGANEADMFSSGLPLDFMDRHRAAPMWPPLFCDWLNRIGLDFAAEGRSAQAYVAFSDAVLLDPNFAPGHLGRGMALARLGRSTEASAALAEALRLGLEAPAAAAGARYQLGILHRDQGRLAEAANEFALALQLDRSIAGARKALALALYELGRHEEAIGELEHVIRDNPDDGDAAQKLAWMRAQKP